MTRFILIGLVLGLLGGCNKHPGRRDNVILITIDTLRADHLGFNGYERIQTPHLDALAAESFRFSNAFTTINTTLASHAAMLTGEFPQTIGVPRNSFPLPNDVPLLQERLQEKGYTTAAFVSAVALCSRMGLHRGFAHFDEKLRLDKGDQLERRAEATVRAVSAWLATEPPEPYFLWVHLFDPHGPYDPPAPYDTLFGSDYAGRADGSMASIKSIWAKQEDGRFVSEEDKQHLIDLYDGEIAYLDRWVGSLLERFDDPPTRARTFVVLASDHGESLTEHDYPFNHGGRVYQPSMRAALLIRPPAGLGLIPREIAAPVQTHSICPTILSHLGLSLPEGIAAADLMPLLRGSKKELGDYVMGEASQPWQVEEGHPEEYQNLYKAQMIVDYPWKLIVTPNEDTSELYELEQDPGELLDLAPDHPERVSKLQSELNRWRENSLRSGTHLDSVVQRRLRSLGYLK